MTDFEQTSDGRIAAGFISPKKQIFFWAALSKTSVWKQAGLFVKVINGSTVGSVKAASKF